MSIEFNNKDKNMFYSMMKIATNYDCRWLNGNIVKYDKVKFKKTSEKIYNSKKAIFKYYNIKIDDEIENSNNQLEENKK